MESGPSIAIVLNVLRRPVAASAALSGIAVVAALADRGSAGAWSGLCLLPIVASAFLGVAPATIVTSAASAAYGLSAVATGSLPYLAVGLQIGVFVLVAAAVLWLNRRFERSHRSLNAAAAEARHALDVQHMINAAYDIDVTLDLVLLKMREISRADAYAVLLADSNYLRVRAASGLDSAIRDQWLPSHQEDHGWTPSDGRPLVVEDLNAAPSCLSGLDPRARSLMAVPLQSVERLVGMLYFGSHEPGAFGTKDVDTAVAFSNQVVFPVQRAMLEEELKRLAFTDQQTSLYNHRHFQTQLDEEVRRAQRYGRPLGLIMLDLDDFKQLNDRHGHPAGDAVLRDVAGVLQSSLRTVDVPARYGGEEFAVICPETSKEQAMVLAERLRSRIADHDIEMAEAIRQSTTVSIGVAAFPTDAGSKSDLIDAADRNLYTAKRSGKNCVVG